MQMDRLDQPMLQGREVIALPYYPSWHSPDNMAGDRMAVAGTADNHPQGTNYLLPRAPWGFDRLGWASWPAHDFDGYPQSDNVVTTAYSVTLSSLESSSSWARPVDVQRTATSHQHSSWVSGVPLSNSIFALTRAASSFTFCAFSIWECFGEQSTYCSSSL